MMRRVPLLFAMVFLLSALAAAQDTRFNPEGEQDMKLYQ